MFQTWSYMGSHINAISKKWSYTNSHFNAMSQTWSYIKSLMLMLMPYPRYGLIRDLINPMS
ncbi:hypothetical protein F383_26990 [Gossypium arboreum]|uniref:Uncharacterized protein n=1 Tax=Gossypium arboreum TaxID=29729 RepID=A0A0B0P443_GOSAR|nr:hypothetical protein F383_26990 [Gossypium arboreum]